MDNNEPCVITLLTSASFFSFMFQLSIHTTRCSCGLALASAWPMDFLRPSLGLNLTSLLLCAVGNAAAAAQVPANLWPASVVAELFSVAVCCVVIAFETDAGNACHIVST